MLGSKTRAAFLLAAIVLLAAGCAVSPSAAPATAPLTSSPTAVSNGSGSSQSPTGAATLRTAPTPAAGSSITSTTSTGTTDSNSSAGSSSGDTVILQVVPGKSQAGYRVREQLAGLSLPSDAVGTTNDITGKIVGKTDGSIVPSDSKFTVDLRTLKSDQSMRDGFIQRNPLETSQYPYATFVPTSASGLPTTLPASGQGSFKLTGDLTIRNVTKPVTWNVTCQVQSNKTEATCQATTSFQFETFNLNQPRVGRVLSITDNITLEVTVDLQRVTS